VYVAPICYLLPPAINSISKPFKATGLLFVASNIFAATVKPLPSTGCLIKLEPVEPYTAVPKTDSAKPYCAILPV
jgi:hypothetical protein